MPWSFHFMDKSVFKIFPASAGNWANDNCTYFFYILHFGDYENFL